MKFVKAIWKLLVGIKDVMALLFLLLFFYLVYGALSNRPQPVGSGVLAMKLSGSIAEETAGRSVSDLAGGSQVREYALRDLVAALREAKDDGRVKAVALDLDGFLGGGQTTLGDFSDAVRDFRKSGKKVIAYATAYTDDSYQVAAAADEIWLNPLGAVVFTGPGGSRLYYKGLLDKLGVTPRVYRVGTYKAAVEPFTRSDMSPEARENAQALGSALLETWLQSVQTARPGAKLVPYMRDTAGAVEAAGGDLARAAVNAGLVDKLGERRTFEQRLADLGGKDETAPGGYERIKLASYIKDKVRDDPKGRIGLVTIAGMIVDGKAAAGTAAGDSIAQAIEKGLVDGGLKALVVRIDSPGGSVLASERIRQAILAAKEQKLPVVVSMGSVAASGGYWVSTPADYVFAEPSTITGSIGVFGILPTFEGTREKLGLGADGIKTTPLSGEPDLWKGPSPEVERLLQAGVDSIYRRFLAIVAQARRKSPADIDKVAQGRVWDGGTARQLGLVDGFGGVGEAIAKAADLAKLGKDARDVRYLERPLSFEEKLVRMFSSNEPDQDDDQGGGGNSRGDMFAVLAGQPQLKLTAAVSQVRALLSGPRLQAVCLECPVVAASPPSARDESLLALVREWLG